MNKTLYDEAVADAKKLRELAEETAKNKVIEAVMPQIRDLVNKRILGEQAEDLTDPSLPNPEEEVYEKPSIEVEDLGSDSEDDLLDVPAGTHLDVDAGGDVNIHIENSSESEDDMLLDDKMAEALRRIIKGESSPTRQDIVEQKVETLSKTVTKLSNVLEFVNDRNLTESQKRRINLSFLHCVREAIKLRSEVIITEGKTQEKLERRLTKTIKEMKNMSKSNRRNIFDFLFEAEDQKESMEGLEEAELSLELTDEEQEELAGAEDPAAVGDALEDILADLEVSMDTEGADEDAGAEEAEDAEEAPAEEDAEDELDLGEADYSEGSHNEMHSEADLEEVYEIDESMLRRELAKMMTEDAVDSDPAAEHGGEVLGDVMLDIDEEDLINVLADEIGNTDVPSTPPMVAAESRRRARARVSQRRLAEARKENAQYRQAVQTLKGQLVEMNLFNAKLLYANKLMQNKNLTMKQQKAIVEALDNAKTLREAKLLFKSLTESLNRKSSKKLTEGSLRTLGSSSRSTRSAQPASNGVEVDRWGVLAGLSSKD